MQFEQIETVIRRQATGTSFGRDFESLCKWYLEHAPIYRGKFRKVWRWGDWPDRWGRDCGIDLIAETTDGELWAVQCKAVSAEHTVTKAEIDSFLAESNRKEIAYRLLIATTDNIGPNALRTIENQARHASVVLRGDLVTAELEWPSKVGAAAPKPRRWKPLPHQRTAIRDVLAGFEKYDRGRLIMACGTGKTLAGMWISEALGSRCTLLLVPSISLAQQNLKEWGRHAKEDFDCLVVCSDETVASDRDDPGLRYVADLGIKPTTNPDEIATFLAKRRSRPALVISTYQSCERVSRGQAKAKKKFDLAICDEAHRLVGHTKSQFATVLDDRRIRARRRLFMTATPRYFTQRAKERGAEQDVDLVSMDDVETFGPEFHVLTFHEAITAQPEPLLTDYQVVVIGVTSAEAKAWVADAKLVRTKNGLETDARTLAAQIGLAKAVQQYNLTRLITFHRSIGRASRFVDAARRDSLPGVIARMRPANRPSGTLWARHVSGETAASKRLSLLKELGELPHGTRGLISNCACLEEGVDVPALDAVAFIDPKGSVVDIIQAVGRVIRKSSGKKIGTIIIPVFVDETEDAERALENSAFDSVWRVLKALRAHDQRLADELDKLRTDLGKQAGGGKQIKLPANIVLDVPRLLLKDFEQAFYVRAVERATERPPLTIEQILTWADEHSRKTGSWPGVASGVIDGTSETWSNINATLRDGGRGLAAYGPLAKLLFDYRGVRNRRLAGRLTTKVILRWADAYKAAHGDWPTQNSGPIGDTGETWVAINIALSRGTRGLAGGSSLAQLLQDERQASNHLARPQLTVAQILTWADEHRQRTGKWPSQTSGEVYDTSETWSGINANLRSGGRGLKPGSSLIKVLESHRGYRSRSSLPRFTVDQILKWCDEHYELLKTWPTSESGPVGNTGESWGRIDRSLRQGLRGLDLDSSLAKLLEQHRKVPNRQNLADLSVLQILSWCDEWKARTGTWPNSKSGDIPGTSETWTKVQNALFHGVRGLPGESSLAKLLYEERGVRSAAHQPTLAVDEIVAWAKRHNERTGRWPTQHSGDVFDVPGENWARINAALRLGLRGLPGGSSIPKLLKKLRRGKR